MHETAAGHMVTQVVTARADEPAGRVRARLASGTWDTVDDVYLLDAEERLVAVLPIAALLAAADGAAVGELAGPRVAVAAGDDQEAVATAALRARVTAVPVVDADGRLLGVVPPLALVDILRREHVEDLHRLAGIAREDALVRESLEAPPLRRARHRLPWLLVGLAGSAVATAIMAGFERALAERVAVAFFVPAIVYLAGAVGTQSEAIAVRGLSLTRHPLGRLLRDELGTGLIIGVILGALSALLVSLVFGDARLGLAVGSAIMTAGAVATTVGLLLPWAIARTGRDPAFGAGPLGTALQDVLSLLVYFAVVDLIA